MPEAPPICTGCGALLLSTDVNCSACHRLVFGEQLQELARQARSLESVGDRAGALKLWEEALTLLPVDSTQAQTIRDHVVKLNADAFAGSASEKPKPEWLKKLGPLGVALGFLLKFKTFGLLFLTKAKFLVLGLGKMQTLFSMLATMGLYWSWYGWKFAVGFVLGIYIHEMGHIWALRRFGLRASAPMFIPGFGAFVSLYDSPANEGQDARIGLAGPLWGAGAAIACLALQSMATGGLWIAVARATATINLFNLIPIWQLDGGRGFRALHRKQRLSILVLTAVLWFVTNQGMFFLIGLGAAYRCFWSKDLPEDGDSTVFMQFAGLLLVFAALLAILPVSR